MDEVRTGSAVPDRLVIKHGRELGLDQDHSEDNVVSKSKDRDALGRFLPSNKVRRTTGSKPGPKPRTRAKTKAPTDQVWSGLAEEVRDLLVPKCSVRVFLNSIESTADRDLVEGLIHHPKLSPSQVTRLLKSRVPDVAPSEHALTKHRRGLCQCEE